MPEDAVRHSTGDAQQRRIEENNMKIVRTRDRATQLEHLAQALQSALA